MPRESGASGGSTNSPHMVKTGLHVIRAQMTDPNFEDRCRFCRASNPVFNSQCTTPYIKHTPCIVSVISYRTHNAVGVMRRAPTCNEQRQRGGKEKDRKELRRCRRTKYILPIPEPKSWKRTALDDDMKAKPRWTLLKPYTYTLSMDTDTSSGPEMAPTTSSAAVLEPTPHLQNRSNIQSITGPLVHSSFEM